LRTEKPHEAPPPAPLRRAVYVAVYATVIQWYPEERTAVLGELVQVYHDIADAHDVHR
jgi:hypothetical protein